jgi:hypothetical protein
MAELDGKSAQIKIGALVLPWVSADYTVERDITDIPPDTATAGKGTIDPDIYQATLSITGNNDPAAFVGSALGALETAFNAGGSSNILSITVQPDSALATYKDVANFRVNSFNASRAVGTTQPWSAELTSTGDIAQTRPT